MRAKCLATAFLLLLAACGQTSPPATTRPVADPTTTTASTAPLATATTGQTAPMTIETPAFPEGGEIPIKYTCDGDNVSPRLDIHNIPAQAVSLVLIVDDPDAPVGTWDHWVEYDIGIPEGGSVGFPEDAQVLGIKGLNSWNLTGYGGPCPPSGENHRYFFTVYALDTRLLIPEGVDSDGVRTAMMGHVIAEASTMGTFSR